MAKQNNLSLHIDKSVIYFFVFVFVVGASTTAFKYHKYAPCNEVFFTTTAKKYSEGELIKFTDNTKDAIEWKWEFGDSTDISTNKEPLHVFKKPGDYLVKLTINNTCEKQEIVTINEKETLIDYTKVPQIDIPEDIIVGTTLTVSDKTPNASKWEWRFGETSSINSTSRYAKYVYTEPGLKTISLIVNGDLKHIAKRKINVLPITKNKTKISQIKKNKGIGWNIKKLPKSAKKKETEVVKKDDGKKQKPSSAPYISDNLFKKKLILVSKDQMSPKRFSAYLCGDINKKIVVNGKNSTFLVFCETIKGKKINLKRVSLFRDKGSNCVTTMTIDYKKKGFWKNILK